MRTIAYRTSTPYSWHIFCFIACSLRCALLSWLVTALNEPFYGGSVSELTQTLSLGQQRVFQPFETPSSIWSPFPVGLVKHIYHLLKIHTGWFKLSAPNVVSHEIVLQYLLKSHAFRTILIAMSSGRGSHTQCFSWNSRTAARSQKCVPTNYGPEKRTETFRRFHRKYNFFHIRWWMSRIQVHQGIYVKMFAQMSGWTAKRNISSHLKSQSWSNKKTT